MFSVETWPLLNFRAHTQWQITIIELYTTTIKKIFFIWPFDNKISDKNQKIKFLIIKKTSKQ